MYDPTRIEMHVDPRRRRISGRTFHGNMFFDVPLISELAHNLWQGGCEDNLPLPDFIKSVVSLYPWERYEIAEGVTLCEIKMYDSEDQGFEEVNEIAKLVNGLRRLGPVLVHCQAGLNRSSLVAARALMLQERLSAPAAIALIREKRSPACLCNKSFEKWLLSCDS